MRFYAAAGLLDEAANVCPWADLPDLDSPGDPLPYTPPPPGFFPPTDPAVY